MHNVDVSIFFGIYHHVHTEIGDRWIPLLRNTYTWIPYFFLERSTERTFAKAYFSTSTTMP